MLVRTQLPGIQNSVEARFDSVRQKGADTSAFLHITNNGRGVEISEQDGEFWLEFWEKKRTMMQRP